MSGFQSATWIFVAVGFTLLVVGFSEWSRKLRGRQGSIIWALIWSMSLASVSVSAVLGAGGNMWERVVGPMVVILIAFGMGLRWVCLRQGPKDDSTPLEHADQLLLERILSLRSTAVGDIMTPVDRVTYAVASSSISDVIGLVRETGHSRIPLLDSPGGRPLGFIHSKDLAPFVHQGSPEGQIAELGRDVLTVSTAEAASRLLETFRQRRIQMAVVADQGGRALGVVTLGDFYGHLLGSRAGTAS